MSPTVKIGDFWTTGVVQTPTKTVEQGNVIYTYSFEITEDTEITGSVGNYGVTVSQVTVTEPTSNDPDPDDSAPTEDPTLASTDKVIGTYTIDATQDHWTKTISNLDKSGTDENGNPVDYTYYVEESTVTNYNVTYENNGGIASGTIIIKNTQSGTPSYKLPETGGNGTALYCIGGLLAMACAAALLLKKRRA
jgi:LPXTG-motif cell wall-anchored protein